MIEAIVLAAGKGERLGTIKPLVPIDGEPALSRVIRLLRQSGLEQITVVLGYAAQTIQDRVNLSNCRVAVNPHYETGMAGSLILGIESLSPGTEGFLILHADMPHTKQETIRAVIAQAEAGARIVAPTYRCRRGFPVFLHRSCVEALLPTLVGDVGARRFIAQHREDLVVVEVADPGAIHDIDYPEDLPVEEEQCEPAVREG